MDEPLNGNRCLWCKFCTFTQSMGVIQASLYQNSTRFRSIDWLDHSAQALVQHFPELKPVSGLLAERLSGLLLERLPTRISQEILELLPEEALSHCSESLKADADSESDTSIGYPDFVQKVASTLGCANLDFYRQKLGMKLEAESPKSQDQAEDHKASESKTEAEWTQKVANLFLWAIAQDLPSDLKQRMKESLPAELRARMDLFSAHADESKVA